MVSRGNILTVIFFDLARLLYELNSDKVLAELFVFLPYNLLRLHRVYSY